MAAAAVGTSVAVTADRAIGADSADVEMVAVVGAVARTFINEICDPPKCAHKLKQALTGGIIKSLLKDPLVQGGLFLKNSDTLAKGIVLSKIRYKVQVKGPLRNFPSKRNYLGSKYRGSAPSLKSGEGLGMRGGEEGRDTSVASLNWTCRIQHWTLQDSRRYRKL